jgi:hypothetical protein
MSIAAFSASEAPIAQATSTTQRTKTPPHRTSTPVASSTLVPEPR